MVFNCESSGGLVQAGVFTPYGSGAFPSNTVAAMPWKGTLSAYPNGLEDFSNYAPLPNTVECSNDKSLRSYIETTSGCLDAVEVVGTTETYTRGKVRTGTGADFRALALGYVDGNTKPIKWTDQAVKYRFLHKGQTGDTNLPGFKAFLRYRSENDLYVASWRFDGVIQIQRKWCDSYSALSVLTGQTPPSQDEWHEIRFEALGNTLKLYIDDVLKITTSASTFSWGTAGIRIDGADGTFLDDWSVYQPE